MKLITMPSKCWLLNKTTNTGWSKGSEVTDALVTAVKVIKTKGSHFWKNPRKIPSSDDNLFAMVRTNKLINSSN